MPTLLRQPSYLWTIVEVSSLSSALTKEGPKREANAEFHDFFNTELDVVEFCTEKLRKQLVPVRDKVREVRKDEEDVIQAGPWISKKAQKKYIWPEPTTTEEDSG